MGSLTKTCWITNHYLADYLVLHDLEKEVLEKELVQIIRVLFVSIIPYVTPIFGQLLNLIKTGRLKRSQFSIQLFI